MALVTNESAGEALAKLFAAEIKRTVDQQMVLLDQIHYGECSGDPCEACEALKPKPLRRRVKAWRWVTAWLWFKPWRLVHQALPGECDCDCDGY